LGRKVAVFGSFVVDLMARTPHMPAPKETVRGSMFRMGAGGKGFNQCVAAHKAGADVTMVVKLGKDSFADVALKVMDELKMPKDYVFLSDDTETGSAIIIVDEGTGQNEIVIVPGANNTHTEEDVAGIAGLLKDSEYVLLQLEVNQEANEQVARLAKECGCKVIVNTAPYVPVSDDFLANAYMVTPNEIEAGEMTGIPVTDEASAAKAAEFLHGKGVEVVVITMGQMGVYISDGEKAALVPAFSVEAVDTTGAGDAFNGGLLAALSEGKELWDAARFAQGLAALSVQKIGTTPSMPWREEVDAFLANN
jgi:ribokinase